jgi:hypothetical protein
VRAPVQPAGFVLSFLTKLAQAEFATGCEQIEAVIGPDSDGGFSIFSSREVQCQRS